jgi:hypothetical protein
MVQFTMAGQLPEIADAAHDPDETLRLYGKEGIQPYCLSRNLCVTV